MRSDLGKIKDTARAIPAQSFAILDRYAGFSIPETRIRAEVKHGTPGTSTVREYDMACLGRFFLRECRRVDAIIDERARLKAERRAERQAKRERRNG